MSATKSVVERKQDTSDKVSEAISELFLDQLRLDVTGTIIVMVGRMWDVIAVTSRYLSTDFVVSDAKGNMIHCSAKATVAHNFLRLKVGSIYSVKNFVVKPNKEYRILKNDTYMLEFDGSATIRKALVKKDGFRAVHQGYTLEWPRGCADREKNKADWRVPNKVYLSSTSSTVIYDDAAIPAIKALKKANSVVEQQTSGTPVDHSQPRAGTLENLLMWDRNRKNDDKEGMELPFMWERHLYQLEVDVSDDTAQAVVVMFNETTTALFKCSADSLMDTTDEIHPSEGIKDSLGSNTLDAVPDNQPHKLKRITRDPSIATSSKPVEERKNPRMDVEDSDTEDSGDSANGTGKKEALQPSDKKRKNRVKFDDSDADVSYGSSRVGAKGTTATHSPMEKRKRSVNAKGDST
ncbi:reverse transcriptase domain-containing protein [Tanacetum coccineum]